MVLLDEVPVLRGRDGLSEALVLALQLHLVHILLSEIVVNGGGLGHLPAHHLLGVGHRKAGLNVPVLGRGGCQLLDQ